MFFATAGRIVLGCSTLAPKYASSDASANESCGTSRGVRHDARIGGEHAVHVGPDLDLVHVEARAEDRRRIVRAAAAERRRHAVGGRADEAAQHRHLARPRARRRPARGVRAQVASMSGTAAVCSASVTSTCARVDPDRRNASAPRTPPPRSGCWPARPSRRSRRATAATPRACAASAAHRRGQLGEVLGRASPPAPSSASPSTSAAATPRCRSSRSLSSFAASSASPVAGEPAGFDQPIGHLRHRRDDDHRRPVGRIATRAGRVTMPITRLIASASATDVPPNFMITFTAVPRGASARRSESRRPRRRESCCGRAPRTCSRTAGTAAAGRRSPSCRRRG